MNPLSVLALCAFLVGLDALVVVPLAPLMAGALGLATDHAGWLVTAYSLAYALGAPLFGPLADRWGRVPVLSGGLLLFSIATAALAAAEHLVSALGLRALAGLGAAAITPTLFALVAEVVAPERRGRATGIVYGSMIGATVIGVPIGALLAESASWRAPFWVVAVAGGLTLIPVRRLGRRVAHQPSSCSGSVIGRLARAGADPRVRRVLGATLLWYAALYGMFTNIGIFYTEQYGLGTAAVGAIILVAGAASVVGNILGGQLADSMGPGRVLVGAAVFAAGAVALFANLGAHLPAAIGVQMVWAFLVSLGSAPLLLWAGEIRPGERSTVLALNSAAMYLGMTLASGLSGYVLADWGFPLLGVACAVLYGIIAGVAHPGRIGGEAKAVARD